MANPRFASGLVIMIVFVVCVQNADGYKMCKRKSIFGVKSYFTCPEPGQTPDMVFCCGDDDDLGGQFCCRGLNIDNLWNGTSDLRNPLRSIGSIIATVAGVIGFLIILFVICCCICPCCILYKRRTGGTVYRSTAVPSSSGPSGVNVTVVPAPGAGIAPGPPPVGFTTQPGGNQSAGYPMQSNYAPQPGYPMQPNYPTQPSYPHQPGYPPYPQPAGFPNQTQPGPPQPGYYSDQPPPYPGSQDAYQKQSAYNPGY